ncbi:MAG: DUF4142 domain-containing protein [Pseudonocardiaceae bacterium]
MIATLVIAVFQYWGDTTQTQWGSLGPADRDLLIKVRQAGLWEIPTSQQAQQQGDSPRVREVGELIAAEHIDLDRQVRAVATQLGVSLPNDPSNQQQVWIAEIAGKSGPDYDRAYVQRLRAAHGKVLPLLAEVRGSTQNELIRSFAETAAVFVTRHCEYLESTGLVDSSALPAPPVPDNAASPPGSVPAAVATPAEAAAGAHADHAGDGLQVNQVAQANTTSGAGVYVVALLYLGALLAIVGLFYLLGGADLLARQNRQQPQARHTSRALPARPRHAAQPW